MSDEVQIKQGMNTTNNEGIKRLLSIDPLVVRRLLIALYNTGYRKGHGDTVESRYVDISARDLDRHHDDIVDEVIGDLTLNILPVGGNSKQSVVTVESANGLEFDTKCSELIENGYTLQSSSCGFVNSADYDFCSAYHAILVLGK